MRVVCLKEGTGGKAPNQGALPRCPLPSIGLNACIRISYYHRNIDIHH